MASDSLVAETARRIFGDLCDPQAVNRAADDGWMAPAWSALEEAGLPLAWVPEALGGSGAGLADGFAVLREAGRAAVPLPIAETLLAGWLLAAAGIRLAEGSDGVRARTSGRQGALAGNGIAQRPLACRATAKAASHLVIHAVREERRHRRGAGGGG